MIKIIKKVIGRIKQAIRNYDKSCAKQMKELTQQEKEDFYARYMYGGFWDI